ncbi:hypothetical protein ACHWQZ_G007915 [Mnemiopsis leidyi]
MKGEIPPPSGRTTTKSASASVGLRVTVSDLHLGLLENIILKLYPTAYIINERKLEGRTFEQLCCTNTQSQCCYLHILQV